MKAAIFGLAALAATVAAGPARLITREDYTVVCETSDASPTTEDVTELINNLKGAQDPENPTYFCVNGSFGNDCSPTWRDYSNGNSAAFQACGEGGGGRFRCQQNTSPGVCPGGICNGVIPGTAAAYLMTIQDQCLSNGRVGGFLDFPDGDFKLIHS